MTRPPTHGKLGPCRIVERQSLTTQASSIASRFIASSALRVHDELYIASRGQERMQLMPEEGGGRVSARRTAPKLDQITVTNSSVIEQLALLCAS